MQETDTSFSPLGLDGIAAAEQYEPFAISAPASLQDVRLLTLKHGDSFGVFDNNGDALSSPGSAQGLYYRDTRHLSHFSVVIDGARPLLLSSTLRDDNATLTCDLTNPDLYDEASGIRIEHDLIQLRRSRFLWNARCFERLSLHNFGDGPRLSTPEQNCIVFRSKNASIMPTRMASSMGSSRGRQAWVGSSDDGSALLRRERRLL